jgi:hypothetical protein
MPTESYTNPVLIWPDLASIQNSKVLQGRTELLSANNTDFAHKYGHWVDLPNCTKLHPIRMKWIIIDKILIKTGGGVKYDVILRKN